MGDNMNDVEKLAMLLSEACLRFTGFGPSKILCEEFAEKITEQARSMNVSLDWQR